MIGVLTLHLHLPGCGSLKQKRGRFNVSAAEMDLQDRWQEAVVCCGMVGNEAAFLQSALQTVRKWVAANWPDGEVLDVKVEIF
jgi:uncharacterized protein